LKILYDHQIFEDQIFGGISRYFSELIKFNPMADLSLKYSENIYFQQKCFKKLKIFPLAPDYDNFIFPFNFKGKGRLYRYYNKIFPRNNQIISIKKINKSNFDLFHPTYYNPYFLEYLKGKPFILTVFDMIHELFPQYYHDDNVTVLKKQCLISQANIILAISENTKKDLLRFFPDLEEKIKVIYLGVSFQQLNINTMKENFILFTGDRINYKNFNAFLKSVAPLLIKYDLNLSCTGLPFNDEENILLDTLNIKDRTTIHKYSSDEKLAELYSKALAFVFPSLYEGFGIPVLEAFASQCPAVLSNTGSLPEIGADAAVYFDPYSIDDMRNQIERVICSSSLRDEMIKKGKKQLKLFSWEKCAKETMEVYKSLA
jgi:glycosyltransferase involved in cell wall biosynthesis